MKKQKTYVAMLLAALVILSLAGCGMKNSKDNAEATTGWSVENPDNTTKDKKTTESTDAEDNIEESARSTPGRGFSTSAAAAASRRFRWRSSSPKRVSRPSIPSARRSPSSRA